MGIESHQSFTPVELDHHESIQVGIVLGSRQIVVGLNQSVGGWLGSWEEIVHFASRVVMDVSEGLNVREPLNISSIIFKPDGSVESHLIVLSGLVITISSMALESFEKMSLKTLSRSYYLVARS